MTTPLPQCTVTFVFTDVEGSTALLEQLGERYADVMAAHRSIIREEFGALGGTELDTEGDAFFFSFARARDAVAAAVAAQRRLADYGWPDGTMLRVRMSLHTGEPVVGEEGYVGIDVVRAARICSAGHGGQVLLSAATAALVGDGLPEGVSERDLGEYRLADLDRPERIFQLDVDGLATSFPPLRMGGEEPIDLETRLQRRIESYVERRIAVALADPSELPGGMGKLASGRLLVGFFALALASSSCSSAWPSDVWAQTPFLVKLAKAATPAPANFSFVTKYP